MSAPELSAAEAATVARFEAGDAAPESWGGSQVAVDLRMAADVLERHGWTQERYVDSAGCHCAFGAVANGIADSVHSPDDLFYIDKALWYRCNRATDYLEAFLDPTFPIALDEWNDEPGRSATEVIAALRAAADKADQP